MACIDFLLKEFKLQTKEVKSVLIQFITDLNLDNLTIDFFQSNTAFLTYFNKYPQQAQAAFSSPSNVINCLNELKHKISDTAASKTSPVASPGRKRSKSSPTAESQARPNEADVISEIPTSNSFSALETLESTETSDNAGNIIMDTTELADKIKTKKPEPIIIPIPDKWFDAIQNIKDDTHLDFDTKVSGEYIKLFTKSLEHFKVLQNYLDSKNINFQCLDSAESRPRKIVIRRLLLNTPEDRIIADFKNHGFTADSARYITGRFSRQPISLFVVSVMPRNIQNQSTL